MKVHTLSIAKAFAFAEGILLKAGIHSKDASLIARHLIAAETRGYAGHGLRRLLRLSAPNPALTIQSQNETQLSLPGFLLINGNGRIGIAAVTDALNVAANQLEKSAAVIVGIKGYTGTTGSLGVYGAMLSDRKITSILMCNSEFAVAPFGSIRAVLGTNPIAISMPGNPIPFTADVATASWSYGAIRDAALAKEAIPKGVVQTAEGMTSIDPEDADRGSQLPMAGHKGYALGLAVELLCGPLIGAKAGRDSVPGSDGFLGILIRTDVVRPIEDINCEMQRLFAEIKSGPVSPEHHSIKIPGESSHSTQNRSTNIELPEAVFKELELLSTKD